LMRLPSEYEKQSLCELMPRVAKCYLRDSIWIRKHLKLTKHSPLHPKSLDSSICQNIITWHRKYKYV
jgi:hypothetical protein